MDSRVLLSGTGDMAVVVRLADGRKRAAVIADVGALCALMTVHFRVRDDATRIWHVFHVAARLTPATPHSPDLARAAARRAAPRLEPAPPLPPSGRERPLAQVADRRPQKYPANQTWTFTLPCASRPGMV